MTLLDNHLEQIQLSSTAIAELPFPAPKIFTNALLHSHDITSLIRDTESHERALFNLGSTNSDATAPLRTTNHPSKGTSEDLLNGFGQTKHPRYGSAAALLGGELGDQFRMEGGKDVRERGEVDVEVLLEGAEKLCAIYPIPGAIKKIASLRARHGQLTSSVARCEARVSRQTGQLAQLNRGKSSNDGYNGGDNCEAEDLTALHSAFEQPQSTVEDFLREEEELRELEKKKCALEDRVSGMERDLGGLLR